MAAALLEAGPLIEGLLGGLGGLGMGASPSGGRSRSNPGRPTAPTQGAIPSGGGGGDIIGQAIGEAGSTTRSLIDAGVMVISEAGMTQRERIRETNMTARAIENSLSEVNRGISSHLTSTPLSQPYY